MKTVLYNTIDKTFIKEWLALWKKSPYANYTNSPQWFQTVVETFGYTDYRIIGFYEKNILVGTAAVMKEKKYGVSYYTVAPGDFVSGIPFLIDIKNRKLVNTLVKAFKELETLYLNNVSDDFIALLEKSKTTFQKVPQALNYYLPLQKDKDGKALIENRKVLMRRVRKMEESFILHSFDGTTSEGIDIIFAIDNQSRKQKNGYSTFADEHAKDFFVNLAKNFKKNICFNILYFEKTPIAYEIGFIVGKTYYGNQIAYNAEYMQYSPGKVLVTRLIEYLVSRNLKKMDLGSGDGHIKRLLTEQHRQFYHVIVSQNGLVKNYIKSVIVAKNYAYANVYGNPKLYTFYKKIMKLKK